jgi:hypothetical protein
VRCDRIVVKFSSNRALRKYSLLLTVPQSLIVRRANVAWEAALFLLLPICTATGFAQNATTSLRGVVEDPTGAFVEGASVTLFDSANGKELVAITKDTGEYQILQISPSKYTITVTASGFGSQSKRAELLVNQPAAVNFVLGLQPKAEIVDVSATAQTLNVADASLGIQRTTRPSRRSPVRNRPQSLVCPDSSHETLAE